MRFVFVALLVCGAVRASEIETDTLRIERVDAGNAHRGRNPFSAMVVNKTDSMLTLVLDLRADPGLWLRKNQRQFVYLLYGKEERPTEAEYEFEHLSAEAFLRVRFYFPEVGTGGATNLRKAFFDRRYEVGSGSQDIDYDLSRFERQESAHFVIYAFPNSLAAQDMAR